MKQDRHLLDLDDAQRPAIEALIARARAFKQGVTDASIRLKGKLVVGMFFEASTRTATSFAIAAYKLGAAWLDLRLEVSTTTEREALEDTMRAIGAVGADAIVVRHRESGYPHALARHFQGSVVNAGDGWHAHPTEGLSDAMTLLEEFGSLDGRRLVICGDIRHSRVARSSARAARLLGARVTLCGPPMLLPPAAPAWGFADMQTDLDACLPSADALLLLRTPTACVDGSELPPPEELAQHYGLDDKRLARMPNHAIVMHPGPVNRRGEIAAAIVAGERSRIERQVENGVFVRMAVLEKYLRGTITLSTHREAIARPIGTN